MLVPGKVAAAPEVAEKQLVHDANVVGARKEGKSIQIHVLIPELRVYRSFAVVFLNVDDLLIQLEFEQFLPTTALFLSLFFPEWGNVK